MRYLLDTIVWAAAAVNIMKSYWDSKERKTQMISGQWAKFRPDVSQCNSTVHSAHIQSPTGASSYCLSHPAQC